MLAAEEICAQDDEQKSLSRASFSSCDTKTPQTAAVNETQVLLLRFIELIVS